MADFSFPEQIEGNTPAIANEVQTNFDALKDWVLANCVQVDGSQSMGAPLNLFGTPASATHAVPKSYVDAVRLVGSISMYGGTSATPPTDFLWCDDTNVYSRFDHVQLYAIIGRSFTPESDPVDSFRLPGLNGRMPVGVSATDSVFALGETGGQRNSELQKHLHSVPAHGHGNTISISGGGAHNHSQNAHGHNARVARSIITTDTANPSGTMANPSYPGAQSENNVAVTVDGHTATNIGVDNHGHGFTGGVSDKPAFNTVESGAGTTLVDKNLPPFTAVRFMIYRGTS